MKIAVLVLCLSVASAAVYAMDLPSLARREKARRSAHAGKPGRSYDGKDLERYARKRTTDPGAAPPSVAASSAPAPRDLTKERVLWRKETLRHERELSRIDAGIRRLEWRLQDKRSRRRSAEHLARDPSVALLEDSIKNLREERNRLQDRFRERARKEGALPGWLR